MSHNHEIIDTDVHYKIDGLTRTIVNIDETKRMLVQNDHNSERFTFEIPREVDGHDFSECNLIQIHYENKGTRESNVSADIYTVNDLHIKSDDDKTVVLSWLISGTATKYVGTLDFTIRFCCVEEDGTITYAWNTTTFKGITILPGIFNSNAIAEKYPDILAELMIGIKNVEKGTIKELDVVNLSTCESGVYLTSKIIYQKSIISQPFTEWIPSKALLIVVKNEKGIIGTQFQWIGASYILAGLSNAEGEFENEFTKYEFSSFATKEYVNELIGNIESGAEGKDGKSAYQIALDNGFEGTEEEWLESLKGEQGIQGETGSTGADGFSPIAKVEKTDKGATITITDKNGTTNTTVLNGNDGKDGVDGKDGLDGTNGKDGLDGQDGVSATHSWNGTVLTVTSASGTSSADLKGDKGDKGEQGVQGVQGDKGADGKDGVNGANGKDGSDGADGVGIKSVVQTTTSSADGGSNIITVTKTDNTTSTFTVKNGSKGSKGDKGDTGAAGKDGSDYVLTEADKAEIVAMVIESLGGNPVFGYVDENNNIIVSGNLADGSYNVKYEMENGSTINIGDLVLDTRTYYTVKNNLTNCTSNNNTTEAVEGGSYSATITANSGYELKSVTVTMGGSPVSVSGGVINISSVTGDIVITAVATEVQTNDTDNILTNGAYTIEMNKRWSNSSKSYSACDGMICITIPTADVLNKTIYFKGFTKDLQSSGSKALWMAIDESLTKQSIPRSANSDGCIWGATYLTDEGNGAYSLAVNSTNFTGYVSSTTYLKLNMAVNASTAVTSLDGLTMTIDKPIS